jgi:hypothetical protein
MDLHEVGCEDVGWIHLDQIGSSDYSSEPSGSIIHMEFNGQLRDCHLLRTPLLRINYEPFSKFYKTDINMSVNVSSEREYIDSSLLCLKSITNAIFV